MKRLLLVVMLLTTACQGDPAASPDRSVAEGATTIASPAATAAATGPPLAITSTPATDAAGEGTVTLADGGTVSAEAADGTTFELVVPPQAVAEDTLIRLTPLTDVAVEGLGSDSHGPVYAVLLEPEGLQLFALARLTITPAEPIPVEDQLAFEAAGDGTDVQLALIDPASEPAVLLLEHFSKGGLGQFTPQQQAIMKAKSATNVERRIAAEVRSRIAAERQRQLLGESDEGGTPDVSDLLEEFQREVIDRRRDAAALSCDELHAYVRTLIGFERQLQLLGAGEQETYAATMTEVRRILDERYPECERQKIEECRAAEDPAILIRFWLANREAKEPPQPPITAAEKQRAEELCRQRGFTFDFSGGGPSQEPSRQREWEGEPIVVSGRVTGCRTEDGWSLGGTYTVRYPDGSGAELELFDLIGNQSAERFELAAWVAEEFWSQFGEPDEALADSVTLTGALTDAPHATATLKTGTGELHGTYDLELTPVEPVECP